MLIGLQMHAMNVEEGGSLTFTIRPVERLVYLNFGRGRLLAIF